MERYIQTSNDENVWEEVDEYTWKYYKKALRKDSDVPRYTENKFTVEDGKVEIFVKNLSPKLVFIISKLAGFDDYGSRDMTHPGGFGQTPEYIRFAGRADKYTIRHMPTGTTYKQAA